MASSTKIEWCDATFNPWRGCTRISEGCRFCYAETLSGRNPKTLGVWGPNGTRVVASEAMWREPVKWNRQAQQIFDEWKEHSHAGSPPPVRPRVFCASLADVFEDWTGPMTTAQGHPLAKCRACLTVGHSSGGFPGQCKCGGGMLEIATMQDVRARLFALIGATPNLDWLVLTKRPENIARMMPPVVTVTDDVLGRKGLRLTQTGPGIRPNVWLGTSVENQQAADERIPHLLRVPAAVRFLSCEPLLGPVDLEPYVKAFSLKHDGIESEVWGANNWRRDVVGTPLLHWVIVGGESGPGARPLHPDWARSLRDQCKGAGVAFHFKQWGEWWPYFAWDDDMAATYEDAVGNISTSDHGDFPPGFDCGDPKHEEHRWPKEHPNSDDMQSSFRVGKRAAGRLLDGREWSEFPEV